MFTSLNQMSTFTMSLAIEMGKRVKSPMFSKLWNLFVKPWFETGQSYMFEKDGNYGHGATWLPPHLTSS